MAADIATIATTVTAGNFSKLVKRNSGAALLLAAGIASAAGAEPMSLNLTAPNFGADGSMPASYTCDGANISPALAWSDLPDGTKSLALIVDDPDAPDPDAPQMTWVHWVLYNLPPQAGSLSEGAASGGLPPGTREGLSDWQRTGYGGPCPPIGTHRYFHKLYALDVQLPDLGKPTKAQLEQAMQGHVIQKAEVVGRYRRK